MIKNLLTIGIGMVGEVPVEGKPKEKGRDITPGKHHYGLYIGIMALLMIVIIAAVFYTGTSSTSTAYQSPQPDPKQPPVSGTATPTPEGKEKTEIASEFFTKYKELILAADTRITPEKMVPINNIPKEIPLGQNLYLLNLQITEEEATGYVENRDTKWHNSDLRILGFKNNGKFVYVSDIVSMDIGGNVFAVEPGQKYPLKIQPRGFYTQGYPKEFTGLKDTKILAALSN